MKKIVLLTACISLYVAGKSQTAHIGIADYGNYTNSNLSFIANNVDMIVSGTTTINIAGLKAINPNIKVFGYWNGLFRYVGDTASITEDMYFHDPNTLNRMQKDAPGTIFDGQWLMNPTSTTWRQFSISEINSILTSGFDGIHIDETIGNLTNSIWSFQGYTVEPTWYDTLVWNNDVSAYIDTLKTAFAPKEVICNGINEFPEYLDANFLSVSDGAIMEGFVYNTLYGGVPPTEAIWTAIMNTYLATPPTKRIGCVTQGSKTDVNGRIFAFTSYLLGVNDFRSFYYNFAPDYDTLAFFPEWSIDLGTPLSTQTTINTYFNATNNVYERDFTNGKVIVNPSTTNSQTIIFSGNMYNVVVTGGIVSSLGGNGQISSNSVTSITLAPQQGAIVLNTPLGVEEIANKTNVTTYPNPSKDVVFFEFKNLTSPNNELILYDITGKVVKSINVLSEKIKLETSDLENGIYFYQLTSKTEIIATGKIILSK